MRCVLAIYVRQAGLGEGGQYDETNTVRFGGHGEPPGTRSRNRPPLVVVDQGGHAAPAATLRLSGTHASNPTVRHAYADRSGSFTGAH
jgi:hypothetical protein